MHTKFLIPVLFVIAIFVSCQEGNQPNNKNLKYPKTTKIPVTDTLFGTAVTDNYRWLEDDRSAETEDWVQAENKVTFDYLSKIPYREQLKDQIDPIVELRKSRNTLQRRRLYLFF